MLRRTLSYCSLMLVGCAPITRTVVVPRATAEAHGFRAEVLEIVRTGVDSEHDLVKARVGFEPGEQIPDEGVVRTRMSAGMMIGGAVMVSLGVVVTAAIAAICAAGPIDITGGFASPSQSWNAGECFGGAFGLGALFGLPGTILLGAGATAKRYVEATPRAFVLPSVSRDRASLAFTVSW